MGKEIIKPEVIEVGIKKEQISSAVESGIKHESFEVSGVKEENGVIVDKSILKATREQISKSAADGGAVLAEHLGKDLNYEASMLATIHDPSKVDWGDEIEKLGGI